MGLFDFFFGGKAATNCEVMPDKIWKTIDAKFIGLAKDVQERSTTGTTAILLVSHFQDVFASLEPIAANPNSVPINAFMADRLSPEFLGGVPLNESATVDIIVGERHPLPSIDDGVVDFAKSLPCRCRLVHHLSLEDPLLKAFSSEWLQSALTRMGMKDDECIQSHMVSRRVRGVQKKVEGATRSNMSSYSAAEWFMNNCPALDQAAS